MKPLLIALLFFGISTAAAQTELTLGLGEQITLTVKSQDRIWIQDRNILTAEGQGHRLQIRGRQEGQTTIKIGPELYSVQVLHPSKKAAFSALQSQLKNHLGLKANLSEGDLLIQGHLYRLQDWVRLAEFMQGKNLSYQMRAHMTVARQQEAQAYFEQLLQKAKLPPQTLIFEPSLEVRVSASDLAFKKYVKLLTSYGIQVLRDESSLDIAPTIKVQITVAEIRKNLAMKYGLQWPEAYSARLLPTGGFSQDELPFNLRAMEQKGLGKILASPNILCRSGKEAEFLAGGEFPIKIMNYKIQDIVWKRYGILLRVKPKADAAGRMSLSIETEVSTMDKATAVGDIPGILTNRVSSHFDLTRPQTIALSGLIKNEDAKGHEGLPFLSRLPILGALFSSNDFLENRTELVIFVRPSIVHEGDEHEESPQHLKAYQGGIQ